MCGPAPKTCFRQESRLRRNAQRGRKCTFNLPGKKVRDKSACELKSMVGVMGLDAQEAREAPGP